MGISITGGVKVPQGKFSVTSNSAPTWTTAAGEIGPEDEGTVVSFQFEASDNEQGTSGLTFSKNSGDFPAGLSMDSAGLLTGTASEVESNTQSDFNLRVTDNGGLFADEDFSMTINDVFAANPVNFDGTNDYLTLTSDLTGNADGKQLILSTWFKLTGNDGQTMQLFQMGLGNECRLFRISSNKFRFSIQKLPAAGGARVWEFTTSESFNSTSQPGWHHILIAVDAGALRADAYIDDATFSKTINDALVDATIDFTTNNHQVGALSNGTQKLHANLAELYFAEEYLDITIEANRRLFISAAGKPVDLGSDGSTPTTNVPIIFLSGDTNAWHTNKGSGGGFNENGALGNGTGPVEL